MLIILKGEPPVASKMAQKRSGYRDTRYKHSSASSSGDPPTMMSLQSPESSGGDSLPPTPIDSLMVTNSQGGYGAHLQKNNDRFTIEDEAIRAQFTPQEIRDLRMVFDTFDSDKTG